MKRLTLLACLAVLSVAQQVGPELDMRAIEIQKDGSVHRLSGQVVIETGAMTIRTEKAEYNENTGEILTHGDTTIKLKQKPNSTLPNR